MRLEVAGEELTTQKLEHFGVIAALCKDLRIAERINKRIGSRYKNRVVQPGIAVVAMIINALGFTNTTLYLTPQFFESKALELFFDIPISAKDLNDHTLGKALDEIYKYGATRLFAEIVFEISIELNLIGKFLFLDSTSFSLHGKYNGEEVDAINVVHGFSKDKRPDLKQFLLSMIVTGEANVPIWMESQDGNTSDKTSFHETIKKVQSFIQNLNLNHAFSWVADSALYTSDKLLKHDSIKWISRVPETIKEAKTLLENPDKSFIWSKEDKGFKVTQVQSTYGGIEQRWIVVSSEQAYNREKKTFEKNLVKKEKSLTKACWHLSNKLFNCPEDAEKAVEALQKKHSFLTILFEIEAVKKHKTAGKPKKIASKEVKGYKVKSKIVSNEEAQQKALLRKGRFIVATNNQDPKELSANDILKHYKDQQKVEGGFRFLKDPWFMLDSFYIKKRSRIEAIMMVMTLSLFVYNYGQYLLRKQLKENDETIPNQLGKPVQNPTLKWTFQLLERISLVKIYDAISNTYRMIVTNLDDLRRKIISFMGPTACEIYGIT